MTVFRGSRSRNGTSRRLCIADRLAVPAALAACFRAGAAHADWAESWGGMLWGGAAPAEVEAEDLPWTSRFLPPTLVLLTVLLIVGLGAYYIFGIRRKYEVVSK